MISTIIGARVICIIIPKRNTLPAFKKSWVVSLKKVLSKLTVELINKLKVLGVVLQEERVANTNTW